MPTSATMLKQKAAELIDPALQQSVIKAIDDEIAAALDDVSPSSLPGAQTTTLATLYLADKLYDSLEPGRFTGRPTVRWDGMDNFSFVDDKSAPFYYETSNKRIIRPRQMLTDGGSIPQLLRGFRKFSPWGYGPSFIIHDWLFVAHHQQLEPDTDWSLESAALVMAASMKSLMQVGFTDSAGSTVALEKAEDTLYFMYLAVKSSFAQEIWDRHTGGP